MELKLREETVAKLTAQMEELSEKHGESVYNNDAGRLFPQACHSRPGGPTLDGQIR